MITFIEKEKYYDNSPFIGQCYYYPTYMIKNGKEYFIFNRREPDEQYKIEEQKMYKQQLIETDGKYFTFYSFYKNPFEMLQEIIKRKHCFSNPKKLFDGDINNGYLDFHGNRKEVSAVFKYRIYDAAIVENLQNIVKCINTNKWREAQTILNNTCI